jgi:IS6 family transposase
VELLAERGIVVDHVTIYRWVQTFTVEFIDAARPTRHCAGDRWFVDETYVKVAGGWTYLYRAVDQHGQVIDVLVSTRRRTGILRSRAAVRPGARSVTTSRWCCGPARTPSSWMRSPLIKLPRGFQEDFERLMVH